MIELRFGRQVTGDLAATGCPFQAWSVAELLRARRVAARAGC